MIKSVVYEESLYPEAFAIFEENGCLTLGSNINKKKPVRFLVMREGTKTLLKFLKEMMPEECPEKAKLEVAMLALEELCREDFGDSATRAIALKALKEIEK